LNLVFAFGFSFSSRLWQYKFAKPHDKKLKAAMSKFIAEKEAKQNHAARFQLVSYL